MIGIEQGSDRKGFHDTLTREQSSIQHTDPSEVSTLANGAESNSMKSNRIMVSLSDWGWIGSSEIPSRLHG